MVWMEMMQCQIGSTIYTPISQRQEIGDVGGYACVCKDPNGDYRMCVRGNTFRVREQDMMDLKHMFEDVLKEAPRYRDME